MANFIELSNAQGPRAINIDHIQSFTQSGAGTRIIYRGNVGQEDVKEGYDVVRTMLNVTSAPQPAEDVAHGEPEGVVAGA